MPLKSQISQYATQTLGFDECRFTDLKIDKAIDYYKSWLKKSDVGDMRYLRDHLKHKETPELLLENAKTAIVITKSYKNTTEQRLTNRFKIARYAVGKDYHVVIRERLKDFAEQIKTLAPDCKTYCGVDSSPIAERSLAIKAGIGFLGKNTMIIKPGVGSYFFIGVILTDLEFEADKPLSWNCGQCRLCIDACPTQAINSDYTLTAKRCISYRTIEQKMPMTDAELKKTEGWLFGCDICQEACPYNHVNSPLTSWEEFLPKSGVGFDFFDKVLSTGALPVIPKQSALYRSRMRVLPNWQRAWQLFKMTNNKIQNSK